MIKEQTKIKGVIQTFRLNADKNSKTSDGRGVLDVLREFIRTKNEGLISQLYTEGFLVGFYKQNNLVTTVGRAVLAERLAGGTTYTGEVNYGALGDDTTAATNADVALGNEVGRFTVSSQAFDDNIAYIDFFIEAGTLTGTHEEFGNFIDGGAGVDSGQMWSHLITGGWTKGAAESLFISCQYTLS